MKIKDLVKTASRYASFRYRKNTPPQYTLTKIMDIIEKLNTFRILEKHPRRIEEQKRAQIEGIKTCWKHYLTVQNSELNFGGNSNKDESWNNAKRDSKEKAWVGEPVSIVPTEVVEYLHADFNHGDKAHGRTKPKIYSDND